MPPRRHTTTALVLALCASLGTTAARADGVAPSTVVPAGATPATSSPAPAPRAVATPAPLAVAIPAPDARAPQLASPAPPVLALPGADARTPQYWLRPHRGTTPVELTTDGAPLFVQAPGAGLLCSTPCRLHLDPGVTVVRAGGYTRPGGNVALRVAGSPMRYVLRSAPETSRVGAEVILGFGVFFLASGGGLTAGGVYCATAGGCVPSSAERLTQEGASAFMLVSGAVLMAGGALITALVAPQIGSSTTGIARVEPLRAALTPVPGGAVGGVSLRF